MSRFRRTKYLINGKLQLAVTFQLTYVMAAMGIIYALSLSLFPVDVLSEMSAGEVLGLMMKATALYFVLTTAILWILAIISTNHIAGPVFVIHRALKAAREGNLDERVTLRKGDHLKELAAEVVNLQSHLRANDEKLDSVRRCIQEGDTQAALELLDSAERDEAAEKAPEAEEVAAS